MFSKYSNKNCLDVPPIAKNNLASFEVLRVWAAPESPQQITLRTTWKDAGAWGLLLVDVARHAAKAYAKEGKDPQAVMIRIRELFDAEWDFPTDEPQDISNH